MKQTAQNIRQVLEAGQIAAAEELLQQAGLHSKDIDGNTLLHHACCFSSAPMVAFLLEKKANIESYNDKKYKPLHYAETPPLQNCWCKKGPMLTAKTTRCTAPHCWRPAKTTTLK